MPATARVVSVPIFALYACECAAIPIIATQRIKRIFFIIDVLKLFKRKRLLHRFGYINRNVAVLYCSRYRTFDEVIATVNWEGNVFLDTDSYFILSNVVGILFKELQTHCVLCQQLCTLHEVPHYIITAYNRG